MVQYLQATDFCIYFNSYESSFVFIWSSQMGEHKTWTADYGLVHGLDHGPFPCKTIALLILVLITTCLSV